MVTPQLAAGLLALGVLLGLAGGYHLGAGQVQARWDADQLQRERQVQVREAQARRLAHAAGTAYETSRSARQAALPALRAGLQQDLATPACTGATHALELADLPVPAAAVDRLRRAAGASLDP